MCGWNSVSSRDRVERKLDGERCTVRLGVAHGDGTAVFGDDPE